MPHVACLHDICLGFFNRTRVLDRQDRIIEHRTHRSEQPKARRSKLTSWQFYTIHQYLFHRTTIQRQHQLKKEILTTKQELLQTSAQDQFAKWAKLRRKVDKGLDDLEKLSEFSLSQESVGVHDGDRVDKELSALKASYSTKFSTAVWLTTSGAQYILGWWFGKQAVFYLPPGWFGPAEWWLSLLFAPTGESHMTSSATLHP